MQRVSCVFFLVLLTTSAVLAKPALPADSDLENDVIPRDPQLALDLPSTESSVASSSSTVKVTSTTEADNKADNRKPLGSDFFSRLMDDIIQIPIAALRAVSQLLNNITTRTRQVAAQATATTTLAPAVTKS